MRVFVATAFLIIGVAFMREPVLMLVGCLALAWVPTLIVDHVAKVLMGQGRPPTLDELLTFDDDADARPANDDEHETSRDA